MKNRCVDYICVGEGEHAFVEFAEKLRSRKDVSDTLNIWGRKNGKIFRNDVRPLIQNLDELPFPDKKLFYEKAPYNEMHYTIMATRGCVLNCPFCHHNVEKKVYSGEKCYMRARSPENVVAELSEASAKYRFRYILFEDDLFLHDREWVRKFCRLYIESGIGKPWFCVAHVWNIDDEIAEMISEAGCRYMEIGVQTLDDNVRKKTLGRPESTDDVEKALTALKKHGVGFNCDHIAGIFGETEETMLEAAKFYNRMRPNRIYLLFLTLYPGTDIGKYALENGFASEEDLLEKIAGRGGTTTHSGSVREKFFDYYRFIFGWLPILPEKFVNILLEKKIFRYLPSVVPLSSVMPEVLSAVSGMADDFRGPVIMKKYIHHILRGGF